ncbi:hypothetical protein O3G_MSEX001554 [Manduca sexta]|uniref:Uncharacterized protein n=1 Tax=Manduca sexta TaxID=7130 RepID=A0A921YKM4_MANSE|nr:hypothetical protein O3G_MSEX001554 [Manduca sexta]
MRLSFAYILITCDYITALYGLDHLEGWNYINLHCRDNDNKPVDWWYIYKPPSDVGVYFESGRNFSFITPDTSGRWQTSDRYITANSMLQYTMSPLFRPTYTDYLGMVAYADKQEDEEFPGSSALGVMMADEMGGLWISHSVKGFPDLRRDRPTFPEQEISSGHMLMCMSLDLVTLNEVAASLRTVTPQIVDIKIPPAIQPFLPDWEYMTIDRIPLSSKPPFEFVTRKKSLRAVMMVRSPGDKRCLYKSFARNNGIVLDVYRHDLRRKPFCDKGYSIRSIDAISLKYPEKVFYIDNRTDRIGFAVSTAAHWQRRSSRSQQYWTCTSNVEGQDKTTKGGLILCVEDYKVWLTFDNLKIKEPEC